MSVPAPSQRAARHEIQGGREYGRLLDSVTGGVFCDICDCAKWRYCWHLPGRERHAVGDVWSLETAPANAVRGTNSFSLGNHLKQRAGIPLSAAG